MQPSSLMLATPVSIWGMRLGTAEQENQDMGSSDDRGHRTGRPTNPGPDGRRSGSAAASRPSTSSDAARGTSAHGLPDRVSHGRHVGRGEPGLAELCRRFKTAVRNKDSSQAVKLHKVYLQHDGQPRQWMFNSLITMYARRSELNNALAVADKMTHHGLAWDVYTYSAILDALAKAQMPPYLLDKKHAMKARHYFAEMQAAGLEPNYVTFHSLMDCQSKAGLADEAFAVLEDMKQCGLKPQLFTFNVLIGACAKAGQPLRAKHVLEVLMPQAGVEPDVVSWNGVLGAFVKVGNIDNAYYTWVGMKERGLFPTRVTASHMSEALVGSPAFLEELLGEARERMKRVAGAASAGPRTDRGEGVGLRAGVKAAHRARQRTRQETASFGVPEDPATLDLHRLSQSSAQAELLRRLNWLTTETNSAEIRWNDGDGCPSVDRSGLLIITGVGRHSRKKGFGVLQSTVKNILEKNDIRYKELSNAGRILVPAEEVEALMHRRRITNANAKLLRGASMRYMFLGCAAFGVLSARYLLQTAVPGLA